MAVTWAVDITCCLQELACLPSQTMPDREHLTQTLDFPNYTTGKAIGKMRACEMRE